MSAVCIAVKLFEVIESDRYLYLVMEYASRGEIFDYLVTNGRMKEKDVRAKFRQVSQLFVHLLTFVARGVVE